MGKEERKRKRRGETERKMRRRARSSLLEPRARANSLNIYHMSSCKIKCMRRLFFPYVLM
jgi:hypothetical protein